MNESKRRLTEYKQLLPRAKEKVFAVAVLLAMSASMMVTVSFAWITLSRAPQLSGMSTNIAANGNLEIALVKPDGSLPDESRVGDSTLATVERNLTWGNIVNLADPAYGLDNLVLRPAQLNISSLLTTPLRSASYGADGRFENTISDFRYAVWGKDSYGYENFMISENYGVRAVSSVTMSAEGFAKYAYEMRQKADSSNTNAGNTYIAITQNSKYMNNLAFLMGTYMTASLNASQGDETLTNPTIPSEELETFKEIFRAFINVYDLQAQAATDMINYQMFLKDNGQSATLVYYTKEQLLEFTQAQLTEKGYVYNGFDQMKKDMATLDENYAKLELLQGDVAWKDSGLVNIVNAFVNVGTCTLDGTKISGIGVSNATQYLDGATHDAVITNGILYNFEQLNGANCFVTDLSVSAKVKRMGMTIPATIKANIKTSATAPFYYNTNLEASDAMNQGDAEGEAVAADTYALAVDFWIRTNAEASYLTLGGNILTVTSYENATVIDRTGNETIVYTLSVAVQGEESTETEAESSGGITIQETVTYEIYKIEQEVTQEDGSTTTETVWYDAQNHSTFTFPEGYDEGDVREKMDEIITVIGYEGDNRVWEENESNLLSADSSTQGSGSCYVFYSDSPEDQARTLGLLDCMYIAFIDEKGSLLATAEMATEYAYTDVGKVIVPMVLRADSQTVGTDSIPVITELEKNVATRITALVYLDGLELTNENVLSSSDIQGKLNIQFVGTEDIQPLSNEELESEIISLSASINKNSFDYETATDDMITRITANINGISPAKVTAFFSRRISATQGAREQTVEFTQQGDGSWVADYEFFSPGTYILRSLQIDGVEYELPEACTVTVTGFAITSVSWSESGSYSKIMTAGTSYRVTTSVKFQTSDIEKMPGSVRAVYMNTETGNAVSAELNYNATNSVWSGDATFLSSGVYVLQYVVLDGDYTELTEEMRKTLDLTLGMKVSVYTSDINQFKFIPSEMQEGGYDVLNMSVKIYDDNGDEVQYLENVSMDYLRRGSSVYKMNTDLTYDPSTGYYVGEFDAITAGAGVFAFKEVRVENNSITAANISPVFTIIPADPPEYVDSDFALNAGESATFIYNPNGTAAVSVVLAHASAANVYGIFENATGEQVEVRGGQVTGDFGENNSKFEFVIPANEGVWTLVQLKLDGVYDETGKFYTYKNADDDIADEDDTPFVTDLTGYNISVDNHVKIYVSYTANQSQSFSGSFLDAFTATGREVKIVDYNGNPFTGLIKSVTMKVEHILSTTSSYGGYSADTSFAPVTITLTDADGDGIFTQTDDISLTYAGEYKVTLIIDLEAATLISTVTNDFEETYTVSSASVEGEAPVALDKAGKIYKNAPVFTVYTVAPVVKVSAITPTGSNPAKITYTTKSVSWYLGGGTQPTFTATGYMTSSFTDYAATVYAVATADNATQRHGSFTLPTLTLSFSGLGSSDAVSLVLPAGDANEITFSRTGNGTVQKTLGKTGQIKSWTSNVVLTHDLDAYYGHGQQTISSMTVVRSGITYTITLANPITIYNPNSENQ